MNFPNKLQQQLEVRKENKTIRSLGNNTALIDFSSNDYLGLSKSEIIFEKTHQFLINNNIKKNGATGSRLLTGNYDLYSETESLICKYHQAESALIFNSGYNANIGFFSCIPQRNDIVLYDEFIHASIRDGLAISNAKAYKFKHNDLINLEKLLLRYSEFISKSNQNIYVVSESVFSMDGDSPDLITMSQIVKKYNAYLIIDEAHAVGVFGGGLIQKLNLQDHVFARIITFGKALGTHGAAVLGNITLKKYLINFSRSLIYTTALSPHSLASIKIVYEQMLTSLNLEQQKLKTNIHSFLSEIKRLELHFIPSCSSIHCCIIRGNKNVKRIAQKLQQKGFDIKPILSPTIPKNKERLRFCLHSYNSKKEITEVLELLATFALE